VLVVVKGIGILRANITVDASDSKIHLAETPSGGIALLPINGEVTHSATMSKDELLALDEHTDTRNQGVNSRYQVFDFWPAVEWSRFFCVSMT